MVASLKMIFRCLILQGIGMTCLALLGLNTEAHGLQDSAAHITEGTLPAVDQAEFKSVIAINPPTEPMKHQQVKPKKHGIIPRTPARRKSELRWLKVDEDQLGSTSTCSIHNPTQNPPKLNPNYKISSMLSRYPLYTEYIG
ncbi:hypothetical protein H4Q26_006274 [Puccinia striiformis f. sp. tritici PST-130]|nr:hypothetical protein H4Q26_006274 [Puccinia striiformis f. sp. tritici PST-130]